MTGLGGRRWLRAALLGGALGAVGAPAGWVISDRLERDNDFCTSCHLTPRRPLHAGIRGDFDARPPAHLAAAHAAAGVEARADDPAFRCIDCHGGASFEGRARVKALAAMDALRYALGRFDEPDGMAWPLWDEDCRKCHRDFDGEPSEDWQTPRFHELAVHNVELGVSCVECHLAHESGGNPQASYLIAAHVAAQCARCHPEFADAQ